MSRTLVGTARPSSGLDDTDRRLVLVQVGDDDVQVDGMTDPVEQVRLLGRVLETLLHECGDDQGAEVVHSAVARWLPAAEEARRLIARSSAGGGAAR